VEGVALEAHVVDARLLRVAKRVAVKVMSAAVAAGVVCWCCPGVGVCGGAARGYQECKQQAPAAATRSTETWDVPGMAPTGSRPTHT
jgi:hypothetical protein